MKDNKIIKPLIRIDLNKIPKEWELEKIINVINEKGISIIDTSGDYNVLKERLEKLEAKILYMYTLMKDKERAQIKNPEDFAKFFEIKTMRRGIIKENES